jgi:hypothetical protein
MLKVSKILILLVGFVIFHATITLAANGPKLPIFHQVGIIPLQWSGPSTYGLEHIKSQLEVLFPAAVKDSRRFRIINDELVSQLWQDPKGREEMRTQFELGAFVGLTVISRADTVKFVARVLGPELQTYLMESDSISRNWITQADDDSLKEKVEHLVFRLFNRIPTDVSVTSVHGPFITLSGGSEQGIELGDKVNLVRTFIKSLHPANGTWLHFKTKALGQAKIVEVKNFTSVAKLIKLTHEDAVGVADGARIPAIASRVKFARAGKSDGFKDSGDQKTIIVPPLYQGGNSAKADDNKSSPDKTNGIGKDPKEQTSDIGEQVADGGGENDEDQLPGPTEEEQAFAWDDFTIGGAAKKIIDGVTIAAGPYYWTVAGPRSVDSNFPWWLVNKGYVSITKSLVTKIKVGYGGGIAFGGTPNGKFYGYDGHARIYWEDKISIGTDSLSWWRAGGHSRINGMSVTGEKYGGGDWIRGGVFGALGGRVMLGAGPTIYDWFAEMQLMPLNIGQLGYDETFYSVESSLGQSYSLGAIQYAQPGEARLGAKFEVVNERQSLNNGRRMHFQEYSIQALMQFDL